MRKPMLCFLLSLAGLAGSLSAREDSALGPHACPVCTIYPDGSKCCVDCYCTAGGLKIVCRQNVCPPAPSSNDPMAWLARTTPSVHGLETAMRRRAGAEAADCGRVRIGQDRRSADACAVEAFEAGKPFFVRYDLQGIDSIVADGMSGDARGVIYLYTYDSGPSGGGNVGGNAGERISEQECDIAKVVPVKEGRRIQCGERVAGERRRS
jgi:hypothetical protein